jgi:hypothetical protein
MRPSTYELGRSWRRSAEMEALIKQLARGQDAPLEEVVRRAADELPWYDQDRLGRYLVGRRAAEQAGFSVEGDIGDAIDARYGNTQEAIQTKNDKFFAHWQPESGDGASAEVA